MQSLKVKKIPKYTAVTKLPLLAFRLNDIDVEPCGGWTHLLQNCDICFKDSVVAAKFSESTAPN